MKLNSVEKITGDIELLTGLHIGSGDNEMHIGGTDSPVIKNPITLIPYIPGSSIKGKIRSLLEWESGLVSLTKGSAVSFSHLRDITDESLKETARKIIRLFGAAPSGENDEIEVEKIGPGRLAFWDCSPKPEWLDSHENSLLLLSETKMETAIDRISGTAAKGSLRNIERVPAGVIFDFTVSMRVHDGEDLSNTLLRGLKLLELTGLGGSGSRGYGKLKITLDDTDLQKRLESINLEQAA